MFFPEKTPTSAERQRVENSLRGLTEPLSLGKAYLRLSHIYKHIGTADDVAAFEASADAAQKAVAYLRQTDDRKSLAAALRASVAAFATDNHSEADAWLAEALAIAEEDKDISGIAWAHQAISTHALRTGNSAKSKKSKAKAIDFWKQSPLPGEVGMAYFQEALQEPDDSAKADGYLQAAYGFHEARAFKNASFAYHMAAQFGEPFWGRETLRIVLRQAIRVGQWAGENAESAVTGAKKMLRRHRR